MGKEDDAARLHRYESVVTLVLQRAEFTLAELKQACPAVKPVSVTQIVRQLEEDGYLRREGPKTRPTFRWTRDRSEFSTHRWIESKVLSDRMTRAPLSDRPRERLLALGPARLRTAELLAILIRSGRTGESALHAGEKIAARYSDRIDQLESAGRGELKAISGAVADTAYCQIMAGIELGRRIERAAQQRKAKPNPRIRGTSDAVAYCQEEFRRLADEATQEEFHLVCLDTKHKVLGNHLVSIGLLNESLVAPREVFRPAIREAAAAVVLVHNHPSGGQGQEDGYLAACEIVQRVVDLDKREITRDDIETRTATDAITGKAVDPAELQERYTAKEYEAKLMLPDRVRAMCEDLFRHLLDTGSPHQKTIIFCARDTHATSVAIELNNIYRDWCTRTGNKPKEDYAFQCTGNPSLRPPASQTLPDFKASSNSHFIATTVDLLSTGVDIERLQNVVFFRYLESPITFYQMVGRGTRIYIPTNKLMFRLYDYTECVRLLGQPFESRSRPTNETDPDRVREREEGHDETDETERGPRLVKVEGFTVQIVPRSCGKALRRERWTTTRARIVLTRDAYPDSAHDRAISHRRARPHTDG